MLDWQKGKKRIFIKVIAFIMAQVFFVTSLGYAAESYSNKSLRVPIGGVSEKDKPEYETTTMNRVRKALEAAQTDVDSKKEPNDVILESKRRECWLGGFFRQHWKTVFIAAIFILSLIIFGHELYDKFIIGQFSTQPNIAGWDAWAYINVPKFSMNFSLNPYTGQEWIVSKLQQGLINSGHPNPLIDQWGSWLFIPGADGSPPTGYPATPWFFVLMLPFSGMNYFFSLNSYVLMNLIAMIAGVVLLIKMCETKIKTTSNEQKWLLRLGGLAFLVFGFPYMRFNLIIGQPNALIAYLMIFSIYLYIMHIDNGKAIAASSVILGLSIGLKIFPAVLLIFFAWKVVLQIYDTWRDSKVNKQRFKMPWTAELKMLAGTILTVIIGSIAIEAGMSHLVDTSIFYSWAIQMSSLLSPLHNFSPHSVPTLENYIIYLGKSLGFSNNATYDPFIIYIITGGILLLMALKHISSRDKEDYLMEMALITSLITTVFPHVWCHYLVFMAFPLLLTFVSAIKADNLKFKKIIISGIVLSYLGMSYENFTALVSLFHRHINDDIATQIITQSSSGANFNFYDFLVGSSGYPIQLFFFVVTVLLIRQLRNETHIVVRGSVSEVDFPEPLNAEAVQPRASSIDTSLLTARPEIDAIFNQQTFPNDIARRLLSNMGIKAKVERNNREIEIDLSWTGVNDRIGISFIPRKEFEYRKPLIVDGVYREDGQYRPYIKREDKDVIEYILPEDVTLNELVYLIEDIDSLTEDKPNRFKLSRIISQRFKYTAIYLAREIPWGSIPSENRQKLEKHIELLYILGDMFEENPAHKVTAFNEMQYKSLELPDGEAWEDFREYLKTHLNLTQETFDNPDMLMDWFEKSMVDISQEVHFARTTELDASIFTKGVEELYDKLYAWAGRLQNEPLESLLKDTLPIAEWRERLKGLDTNEEMKVVKEIVREVGKYPGWLDEFALDWAPSYIIETEEMSCIGRAILTVRILNEVGIPRERIYACSYPANVLSNGEAHVFVLLELSDGSYGYIGTSKRALKFTKKIKDGNIPKGYLRLKLNMQKEATVKLSYPLRKNYRPETRYISVSYAEEGLMSFIYSDIGNYLTLSMDDAVEYVGKLKILDLSITAYRKAIKINKENAGFYYLLGKALYKKSSLVIKQSQEEGVQLLDEAIEIYKEAIRYNNGFQDTYRSLAYAFIQKSNYVDAGLYSETLDETIKNLKQTLKFNKNDALVYYWMARVLSAKSRWIRTSEQIKSQKLLEQARDYYEQALRLDPNIPAQDMESIQAELDAFKYQAMQI